MMVTLELEGVQGLFEMVQAKTFVPKPSPVMFVLGRLGFVIVPLPETKVQIPVPVAGKFPFMEVDGEEIQSV